MRKNVAALGVATAFIRSTNRVVSILASEAALFTKGLDAGADFDAAGGAIDLFAVGIIISPRSRLGNLGKAKIAHAFSIFSAVALSSARSERAFGLTLEIDADFVAFAFVITGIFPAVGLAKERGRSAFNQLSASLVGRADLPGVAAGVAHTRNGARATLEQGCGEGGDDANFHAHHDGAVTFLNAVDLVQRREVDESVTHDFIRNFPKELCKRFCGAC